MNVAEFRRKDPLKTNADRQAAEAKVAPRMSHDPAPIRELAEQLDDLVDAVVAGPGAARRCPRSSASAWDLDAAAFAELKAAADTPERREDLHRRIDKAFDPARSATACSARRPCRASEESHLTLMVRPGRRRRRRHEVHKDRLLPERIKKPDGPVAREFVAAFRDAAARPEPLRAGRRAARGHADAQVRGAADRPRPRGGRGRASRTPSRPTTAGDVLVAQDEQITEDHLALLRLEHETAVAELTLGRARPRGPGRSSCWSPPCSR